MSKEIIKPEQDWHQELLFDLKKLAVTGIVEIKHRIGKRILKDELKFSKATYGKKTIEGLAEDLDISSSDLWACVKFARKYPELSDGVRESSWRHITHNLLPEHPGERKVEESVRYDFIEIADKWIQKASNGKMRIDKRRVGLEVVGFLSHKEWGDVGEVLGKLPHNGEQPLSTIEGLTPFLIGDWLVFVKNLRRLVVESARSYLYAEANMGLKLEDLKKIWPEMYRALISGDNRAIKLKEEKDKEIEWLGKQIGLAEEKIERIKK
jgi:hypothetical protein